MTDTNCRHAANFDWQGEYKRLKDELNKSYEQFEVAKAKHADMSQRLAFLEGQIKAFEFCIEKGGVR